MKKLIILAIAALCIAAGCSRKPVGGPSDPGPASTPAVVVATLEAGTAHNGNLYISYTGSDGQLHSFYTLASSWTQAFTFAAPCQLTLTAAWDSDSSPNSYNAYAYIVIASQACASYWQTTTFMNAKLHCCFDSAGVPCACP